MSRPLPQARLLASLVQDYWAPVVVFDTAWQVVVWNRQAEEFFGVPESRALGQSLEATGILPDPGYAAVLRTRVEASGDAILAGDTEEGHPTQVLRLRRIEEQDETLGFLCVIDRREASGLVAIPPADQETGRRLVHDLKQSIEAISRGSERLATGGPGVQDVRRAVGNLSELVRRLDQPDPGVERAGASRARSSHGQEA